MWYVYTALIAFGAGIALDHYFWDKFHAGVIAEKNSIMARLHEEIVVLRKKV